MPPFGFRRENQEIIDIADPQKADVYIVCENRAMQVSP